MSRNERRWAGTRQSIPSSMTHYWSGLQSREVKVSFVFTEKKSDCQFLRDRNIDPYHMSRLFTNRGNRRFSLVSFETMKTIA